ncbi:MAG TPA: M23 family metallopeptidase [Devosia sp.]|nr:M23 family metallopeptidase [Devosia sp.]
MRQKLFATRPGKPDKPRRPVPTVSRRLFYLVFAGLFATNVATALALLMTPDIAALINGRTASLIAAYDDRLAELRLEVDRLHSRQYARAGDLNLQLQELAQQQEVLAEQHQYVKALAEKAAELGIGPIPPATPADKDAPAANSAEIAPLPASVTLKTADAGEAAVEQAGHQVRAMMDDSREALAALSAEANSSTEQILDSLKQAGIKPALPVSATDAGSAMGGPELPPQPNMPDAENLVDEANAVGTALTRLKDARQAIAAAPVHMPVAGPLRMSSGFGNRTDPFTGRQAFHPGIDLPWPSGTDVMAAGDGKVIYVGQINGYGNVIDIDHGGGLVTRYGHLSAFIAREGDVVHTGTPIGRVGSTGRSTGPHLHFEVRRNDQPVDPTTYLALGRRLAHFLTPTAPADDNPAPVTDGGQDGDLG